jgi:hypothetical protein
MGASGPERATANPVNLSANLPPTLGHSAPLAGDSVTALLGELSQSDLTRILRILDLPLQVADIARADGLLRAAADAVTAQNTGHTLDLLRQFAGLDPARAETLPSNPSFAAIRPNLDQLLSQLGATARLHAENRLADATQKLEMSIVKSVDEVRPEISLLVAANLIEAGGLCNYVRSAALSAALLDQLHWAPAQAFEPAVPNPPNAGWRYGWQLLISIWIAFGIITIGLCWWLREDYLPIVCGIWALALAVVFLARHWRHTPRS